MSRAELKSLTLERFKSYLEPTTLELAPLTILLGRNNSGKSSLIQALLLLKQTLGYPRSDVPLHLEGPIEALHLRELTTGWPETASSVQGPRIRLTLESDVNVELALGGNGRRPDLEILSQQSAIEWITAAPDIVRLRTNFDISFCELNGNISIDTILLTSTRIDTPQNIDNPLAEVSYEPRKGEFIVSWHTYSDAGVVRAKLIDVELDHFIPLISIDKRVVGPRNRERAVYYGFKLLFEQPLEDLRQVLVNFHYLGSTRTLPSSIYRPATAPPEEVGVSGEYAAQMLHARKVDKVHFVRPLQLTEEIPTIPNQVISRSLVDAFSVVMRDLGIDVNLNIEDIENIGFRLLFGGASLQHVGRGIGYVLPVVLLGLISDPLRFDSPTEDISLTEYLDQCPATSLAAIEEPETHLHPKIQTHLAHWFVALAMTGRQQLIETHSDHLVRRLRGLIARAPAGSDLEKWLSNNVVIAEVEQTDDGHSRLVCSRLTEAGGIEERWPADFMDEAAIEERSIYYAGLDKGEDSAEYAAGTEFIHDPSDE